MKNILLVLLLPLCCFGQKSKASLSDTSMFMGVTKNGALLQSKTNFSDPTIAGLPDGTFVAVISYERPFWRVVRDTTIGYIDEPDLDILDDMKDYLKSKIWHGEEIREKSARELDKVIMRNELEANMKTLKAYEKKGFVVTSWDFSSHDEYTSAFDVSFNIFNPTKKIIKYIWFTITAYNPVGDVVGKPKTVNAIGPVKAYEGSSWDFEYVFISKAISCMRISKVKVQYMDGSIKEYPNPNLVIGEGERNSCK